MHPQLSGNQSATTIATLESRDLSPQSMPWGQADGCSLPFADGAFDIVIEHLADAESCAAMAREFARVCRCYAVQTPNRRFPVEAHTLTPGFHFLPRNWQVRLARNFTVWGWLQRPGREEARGLVENIRLLAERELQRVFPDATIERERFLGLAKSVTAVRKQPG